MATTVGSLKGLQYEVRWFDGREWQTPFRSAGATESAYDTAFDNAVRYVRHGGVAVVDQVNVNDPSYRYEMTRITVELG